MSTFYRYTFRPLSFDDLPRMAEWLSDPDVRAWYRVGDGSVASLTEHFGPGIRGEDSTSGFIVAADAREIGYIQTYSIEREPEYAAHLQIDPGAWGIDLFIGEADYRGRGVGAALLRAFTDDIVFGEFEATYAVIGPHPDNVRAIRSYERAGFRWLKDVVIPDGEDAGPEFIMVRYPESSR